jgi:hypothetical protein
MNLKFCFLTPEQEEALKAEKKTYTDEDRNSITLLANAVYDLIHILEIYTLDNQEEIDGNQFLTMFQILGHLFDPVYEYFTKTSGLSLKYKENAAAGA